MRKFIAVLALLGAMLVAPPAHAVGNGKMLVIVFENKTLAQVTAKMPYFTGLGNTYGRSTKAQASSHPSLPNYLMMAFGSTYNITDDKGPSAHPIHDQSVFGNAIAHGRTAKVYADAMPSNCLLKDSGLYRPRHTGWPYAADERSACNTFDVPGTRFAQDLNSGLPTLSWYIPSMGHDGHAPYSTIQDADNWLRSVMPGVLASNDFKNGMAVVLTFDEGKDTNQNIAFAVVQNSLHGKVVTTTFNQHDFYKWELRIGGTTGGGTDAGTLFGL